MKRPALAVAILAAASLAISLAWTTGTWTTVAWAGGDAEAGRKISETHCARCHVVGDFNPMGGIGSTPSFQLLAKRPVQLRIARLGRLRESQRGGPDWLTGFLNELRQTHAGFLQTVRESLVERALLCQKIHRKLIDTLAQSLDGRRKSRFCILQTVFRATSEACQEYPAG